MSTLELKLRVVCQRIDGVRLLKFTIIALCRFFNIGIFRVISIVKFICRWLFLVLQVFIFLPPWKYNIIFQNIKTILYIFKQNVQREVISNVDFDFLMWISITGCCWLKFNVDQSQKLNFINVKETEFRLFFLQFLNLWLHNILADIADVFVKFLFLKWYI